MNGKIHDHLEIDPELAGALLAAGARAGYSFGKSVLVSLARTIASGENNGPKPIHLNVIDRKTGRPFTALDLEPELAAAATTAAQRDGITIEELVQRAVQHGLPLLEGSLQTRAGGGEAPLRMVLGNEDVMSLAKGFHKLEDEVLATKALIETLLNFIERSCTEFDPTEEQLLQLLHLSFKVNVQEKFNRLNDLWQNLRRSKPGTIERKAA